MVQFDLFAFLDGASPWWWIALAMFPSMPGTSQLLTFALLSILYTGIGWAYVRRRQPSDGH